jgi:hypothetical protein
MIWDGEEPLAQVDTAGKLKEYWTRADQALPEERWSRLVRVRVAGSATPDQYAHSDWEGTVVALSQANGTGLAHSGSSPRSWGEGENASMTPLSWQRNHGYWGEPQLARPMHYVRARWCVDGSGSMAPGRLSADPLGFGGKNAAGTQVVPWGRRLTARGAGQVFDAGGKRLRVCGRGPRAGALAPRDAD